MNASIAIQVLPDTRDEDELIRIVDEVIAYIKSTGLNCSVGPFEMYFNPPKANAKPIIITVFIKFSKSISIP